MTDWRTDERIPSRCFSCEAFSKCGGGCRYKAELDSSGVVDAEDSLMDIDAVPKVIDFLKSKSMTIEPKELPSSGTIKLLVAHIRKESFGGVLMKDAYKRIFVDRVGFDLISKLLSMTASLNIEDVVNDKNRKFLSMLYSQKFLDVIS